VRSFNGKISAGTWLLNPVFQLALLPQELHLFSEGEFSGGIQDLPGQGPVQPALGDPASAGGLDWVTHRGPFQPLTFCEFAIFRTPRLSLFVHLGDPDWNSRVCKGPAELGT